MATTWMGAPGRVTAMGGRLLTHALFALVVLVLAAWALQFQLEQPPVPLIWPASAVALAAAWRVGRPAAGTVALALLAVHLYRGAEPLAALLMAAGTGAAGVLGSYLLHRWAFDGGFARTRDVGLLLLVGGGVSAALSAFAGSLSIAGLDTGLAETFGLCWVADGMGALLIAPVLLSVRHPSGIDAEGIAWPVGAAAIVYGIYAGGLPEMLALPASYVVFPLVMAVALRRSVPVVVLVVAAIAAIAITCTAAGKGPFVHAGMRPDMLALHAQLAMLALTGLLLAAIRNERAAAESRAREHLRILARAGRISAISTMAAGIAHEINQPLCAVHSYAQTAQRLVGRDATLAELEPVLGRIVQGTEKLGAIVRRMRGFLRGEPASRALHDLDRLVREAVDLVRPECRRQRVRVQLDLAEAPLPVRVDAVEIQQVVVNLVQNALDALADRPDGAARWVRVATRARSGRMAELIVSDSGPGLPDGDPDALFEPLTGGRNGSGLGLAIVRSIVEIHGGGVTAANTPASGAEFRVRLPAGGHEPGAGDG